MLTDLLRIQWSIGHSVVHITFRNTIPRRNDDYSTVTDFARLRG